MMLSILDGMGTKMPSFRGRISEKEAQELVAFIRAANSHRAEASETAPTEFKTRFDQLGKQFRDLDEEMRKIGPPGDR
jgi:hypothetical protein